MGNTRPLVQPPPLVEISDHPQPMVTRYDVYPIYGGTPGVHEGNVKLPKGDGLIGVHMGNGTTT